MRCSVHFSTPVMITSVRLLPRMSSHVLCQVALSNERLLTTFLFTPECVSRVASSMRLQPVRGRELFSTSVYATMVNLLSWALVKPNWENVTSNNNACSLFVYIVVRYYWLKAVSKSHTYRAFSCDVMAAILVFQNNEMEALLVYPTNPVRAELFSYVNTFFCSNKFVWLLTRKWKRSLWLIYDLNLIYCN